MLLVEISCHKLRQAIPCSHPHPYPYPYRYQHPWPTPTPMPTPIPCIYIYIYICIYTHTHVPVPIAVPIPIPIPHQTTHQCLLVVCYCFTPNHTSIYEKCQTRKGSGPVPRPIHVLVARIRTIRHPGSTNQDLPSSGGNTPPRGRREGLVRAPEFPDSYFANRPQLPSNRLLQESVGKVLQHMATWYQNVTTYCKMWQHART